MTWLTALLARADQAGVARPLVLGVTLWLTYEAYTWATHFADATDRPGAEVALILAATTAPISALQAFIFKAYLDSRQ